MKKIQEHPNTFFVSILGEKANDANLMQLIKLIKEKHQITPEVSKLDELYLWYYQYLTDNKIIQESNPIINSSKVSACKTYNLQYLIIPVVHLEQKDADGNPVVLFNMGKLCYNFIPIKTHHPALGTKEINEAVRILSTNNALFFNEQSIATPKDIETFINNFFPQNIKSIAVGLENYCVTVLHEQEKIPYENEFDKYTKKEIEQFKNRLFKFAVFIFIEYCKYVLYQVSEKRKYKDFSHWFPNKQGLYSSFNEQIIFDAEYENCLLLAFQLSTPSHTISTYGTKAPNTSKH